MAIGRRRTLPDPDLGIGVALMPGTECHKETGMDRRTGSAQTSTTPSLTQATPTDSTFVESGYAPVNGLEIYYEIHGSGEGVPLFVLHGSFMTIPAMLQIIAPLAASRRVIAIESQGHGRTADIADRQITYETLADDAAGVLDHLGVEQADVLGYSLGACMAIRLAIRHPRRVRKLVSVAGTYRLDGWEERIRDAIAQTTPDTLKETPLYEDYLRLAPRPDDWPTFVRKMVDLDTTVPQDVPVEDVQRIAVPALVIAGDQDGVTPQHTVDLFVALGGGVPGDIGLPVPKSQLAIIPNHTHVQIGFTPAEILRIIPPFLDAEAPSSATPAA